MEILHTLFSCIVCWPFGSGVAGVVFSQRSANVLWTFLDLSYSSHAQNKETEMQLAIFYSHLQEFWLLFFHAQFAQGKGFYSADADTKPFKDDVEGRINHVLRRAPASGGGGGAAPPAVGGSGDGFEFRACRIIGFAELLYFFGNEFTAAELHCYWCNARRLCTRRPHPMDEPGQESGQSEPLRGHGPLGPRAWCRGWGHCLVRQDPQPQGQGQAHGQGQGQEPGGGGLIGPGHWQHAGCRPLAARSAR